MTDLLLIVVSTVAVFQALTIGVLLWAYMGDRGDWRDERRELLNRIKPETAQHLPHEGPELEPTPGMDDDKAYWEARGEAQ